ncbi:unnamed protein product [Plutella xylostella]|uniref:(diamondback moth) hypothetical protein n=1 Tax=Plutella xylostella TaxID=51655 RepID=A0A8S4EVD5_PLUXY|nr:unnamed protein product [Plutella xylostella]
MEFPCRSHWLALAALLAACAGAGAGPGRRAFTPSESILDFVDTEQVERVLAARRREPPAPPAPRPAPAYLQRNELGDGAADPVVISVPDPTENSELPPNFDFRKVLKSSKNALVVTKKEYLKEDWCKTEPLVQKIREPGCISVTVLNKFCYGQCNSFYIPKGPRRRDGPGDERPPPAFKSCSFCRPKKVSWVTVTLRCPGQTPPYKRKRLQKIKQCKCLPGGVN